MTTTKTRQDQVGQFFATNADRLRRVVTRNARTNDDIVDDACATAWTKLLRRPEITLDGRGFSWLATVAIHEAWHLHSSRSRETPVGTFQRDSRDDDHDDVCEPVDALATDTENLALDRIQHAVNIQAFATLKPRERQALYLKALGYRYHEICQLTGFSYTAVNRYITEGRRALRRGGYAPAGGENAPGRAAARYGATPATRRMADSVAKLPAADPGAGATDAAEPPQRHRDRLSASDRIFCPNWEGANFAVRSL
jgi:RNA polymerase sigma factor (sigma-70 family)